MVQSINKPALSFNLRNLPITDRSANIFASHIICWLDKAAFFIKITNHWCKTLSICHGIFNVLILKYCNNNIVIYYLHFAFLISNFNDFTFFRGVLREEMGIFSQPFLCIIIKILIKVLKKLCLYFHHLLPIQHKWLHASTY